MDIYICSKIVDTTNVRGSGGMSPQEILQIWIIEIEFGSNFE